MAFRSCFQELDKQNQSKIFTKLVAFSARRILTFQLWEFQPCKTMLRVRSTKQELNHQQCEVLTSDTLLVTKTILMIVVNLFLLTASAMAKTASTIVDSSKNLHSIDAGTRLGLHMVNFYSSYNSCADLGAVFQVMFPDSKIVSQFTLGKTKAKYTILYRIAPEFKKQLIYDINASPFYTVSFDESLNSQVQISQMDVGVQYWNNRKNIAETATLTQNS